MKRNLSAIIALVLVVVMVFPTAIFVGAADPVAAPAEDVIKATVSGGINADTDRPMGTQSFDKSGTITIALTGTANGSITLPKDYTNLQV
ncbi:MAG: hypothetical protein IKV57_05040, partial [Clostridia bacterium]|nr:hypothetical protein [Clostridia bacterium]